MLKNNILSIQLKAIRDSGLTNMWMSNSVQYYAFNLGMFELVNWLEENKDKYTTLLIHTEYDKVSSVENINEMVTLYKEKELDINENRIELINRFKEQVENYNNGDYKSFYKLEIESSTLEEKYKGNVNKAIIEESKYHYLNHVSSLLEKKHLGKFVLLIDGLYSLDDGGILDHKEWITLSSKILENSPLTYTENEIYNKINNQYRLKTLLFK